MPTTRRYTAVVYASSVVKLKFRKEKYKISRGRFVHDQLGTQGTTNCFCRRTHEITSGAPPPFSRSQDEIFFPASNVDNDPIDTQNISRTAVVKTWATAKQNASLEIGVCGIAAVWLRQCAPGSANKRDRLLLKSRIIACYNSSWWPNNNHARLGSALLVPRDASVSFSLSRDTFKNADSSSFDRTLKMCNTPLQYCG